MQIEKNVPLSEAGYRKWPFPEMEVGDSIAIPQEEAGKARNAACSFQRYHKGVKFSIRKVEEGKWRLWRVS